MQDKITIADAPECLTPNDKAMWVPGYQAALAARSTCLHQIQVPSAAEQAAWHAGLDEGRAQAAPAAVAAPDLQDMLRELRVQIHKITVQLAPTSDCSGVWMAHDKMSAALAATPAAAPAWDGKLPERMQRVLNELRIDCKTDAVSSLEFEVRSAFEGMHTSLATVKRLYHAAQKRLDSMDAAQPDPFAAAAPVVLPEPALYVSGGQLERHCDPEDKNGGRYIPARKTAAGLFATPLYTEPQLRALLATATGLPAQPIAYLRAAATLPEYGGQQIWKNDGTAFPVFAAPQAQAFQQRVQPWMMACFGHEISADRSERNHRFLEEALELVQSCGCTASEAHQLVEYVFGRPVGDPMQEAGGVMVTLAALCLANDLDMHACGETELARIWTKVEAIRAKQAAKPKHSPLPEHAPQAQAVASIYVTEDGQRECDDWKAPLPIGRNLLYTAPAASEQDALRLVRQAVRDFHYALDNRKHGGVAAGAAMNAIELALNMYWQQGQEADRRANQSAQGGE